MDLGEVLLRKAGTNYLRHATHVDSKRTRRSTLEITWTDGSAVFISTLDIAQERVIATEQIVAEGSLGNKSPILGTAWSKKIAASFLAIFSADCVSVWLKNERRQKDTKVELSLVQEFTVENCCAQGFEWHPLPQEKLFAIVCRNRAAVCKIDESPNGLEEQINCYVTVFCTKPKLENLRCCSWSEDGHHLLIGAGKKLVLCSWQDLSDISTFVVCVCDSFDTHGNISCISSVGESRFVASAEVQLDKLCSLKIDEDLFEIPQLSNGCELVEDKDEMKEKILRRTSFKEEHSLLNLKYQNSEVSKSVQPQLMLISCRQDKLVKLCCRVISGLISPDLLTVDPLLKLTVVGSNTSNKLQIFSLLEDNNDLKYIDTIYLDVNNRPKGLICKLPASSGRFLVLQGKPNMEIFSNTLPVTSLFDKYKTRLKLFEFKEFLPSGIVAKSANDCKQNSGDIEAKREIESLQLPGGKIFKPSQGNAKPLVEELSTPNNKVKAANIEDVITFLMEMKADVQTQLKNLHTKIQRFETRIRTPSHCVCKEMFPTFDQAEFVSMEFINSITNESQKEIFLLENGKLKLGILKETFNVNIVKIRIGNKNCIISEDPNGYIPLQFVSGSTVKLTGC